MDQQNKKTGRSATIGLFIVFLFFVGSGYLSYSNTKVLSEDAKAVTRTHEVLMKLEALISLVKDAETGQRGYVITGNQDYLEPYNSAKGNLEARMNELLDLLQGNREQLRHMPLIKEYILSKMSELQETIDLRSNAGFEAARAVVETNRGKNAMDELRSEIAEVAKIEQKEREQKLAEMERAYDAAIFTGILSAMLGIFLSCVIANLLKRARLARERELWMQQGESGISSAMLGDQDLGALGENILKFISSYLNAQVGAFFVNAGNGYQRVAAYGLAADSRTPQSFEKGESLLGQAAKENKTFHINDVPENYLDVTSSLGKAKPRHILISPSNIDGHANAVLELGFVNDVEERTMALLELIRNSIGVAVKSSNYRAHLQNLLEETQRQSEELQAQSEELRVSNEELEEQSRALRESQVRLEQQQAELEQTNSQLEEQTQQLEIQKSDLESSRSAVQNKARELEQASQYKSDFLANMSHELRTPLNSSLILAKLLADNPAGNLTEEQVKFAHTIQNSGNDLLALINDILDLSKIEAGYTELRSENVTVSAIAENLLKTFDAMAKQKNIELKLDIDAAAPKIIETDRQRLEQILKNLLSNALKFTEKGSVILSIKGDARTIKFSVKDTGIGISPEHQKSIFEAFRQADSTISRKYGGTGLGLSISRQLTRLLGGSIDLLSEAGKGSTFSITLPLSYEQPVSSGDNKNVEFIGKGEMEKAVHQLPVSSLIKDDRADIEPGSRLILVIEDDESFARIIFDLAHELDFQCIVAASAEAALNLVTHYMPHAIILDVGLPDNSGLSVLDRLKREARTRHIPVHVISANDYSQTALSLGAVGYLIKPVKRNELVDALKGLEEKLSQSLRRILIVEDNDVQRDSMIKLLSASNVETIAVGTAGECLEILKTQTFDCMVLDLSLPDATGFALLQTLSDNPEYAYPPVIVYTGKSLSVSDEQKLRKYSKSIIIKGAKSPERLLDEVTLFLHRVVSDLPPEQQKMLEVARNRDAVLEGRRILVIEDDVANVFALTSVLEPRGAIVEIARNGREGVEAVKASYASKDKTIDLVLMDMMMPEMDGLVATHTIRQMPEAKKLPIIMLTAKAMKDDQERCIKAGANDYMAKPLDVEKLLSLVRVWMPR